SAGLRLRRGPWSRRPGSAVWRTRVEARRRRGDVGGWQRRRSRGDRGRLRGRGESGDGRWVAVTPPVDEPWWSSFRGRRSALGAAGARFGRGRRREKLRGLRFEQRRELREEE